VQNVLQNFQAQLIVKTIKPTIISALVATYEEHWHDTNILTSIIIKKKWHISIQSYMLVSCHFDILFGTLNVIPC
jgi:hypothetical protein